MSLRDDSSSTMLNRLLSSFEDRARKSAIQRIGHEQAYLLEHRVRKALGLATWWFRGLERPIFLWGAGRTGSYLLYDLLSLHPGLLCTRRQSRHAKGLYGAGHHGTTEHQGLLNNPFPPIEGGARHLFRNRPHLATTEFRADDVEALRKAYRRLGASAIANKRVLEKDPHYTFIVDMLETAFPDAFHIHCVRHPNAVVNSYIRRMTEPGSLDEHGFWGWRPRGWEAFRDRSPEARGAWAAVSTMQLGLMHEQRLGARAMRVSYEECVARPRETVERVLRFCELPQLPQLDQVPTEFPNYNRVEPVMTLEADVKESLDHLVRALGYRASEDAA